MIFLERGSLSPFHVGGSFRLGRVHFADVVLIDVNLGGNSRLNLCCLVLHKEVCS